MIQPMKLNNIKDFYNAITYFYDNDNIVIKLDKSADVITIIDNDNNITYLIKEHIDSHTLKPYYNVYLQDDYIRINDLPLELVILHNKNLYDIFKFVEIILK